MAVEEERAQHKRPEASLPDPKRAKAADDPDGDAAFGDTLEEAPTASKSTALSSQDDPKHLEAIKEKAKERQAELEKAKGAAEDATKKEATRLRTWGKSPPPPTQQQV